MERHRRVAQDQPGGGLAAWLGHRDVELLETNPDPTPNPNPNPNHDPNHDPNPHHNPNPHPMTLRWGYSIAAAKVGLKHQEFRNFQVEPGGNSGGEQLRDFETKYWVFHYTYRTPQRTRSLD